MSSKARQRYGHLVGPSHTGKWSRSSGLEAEGLALSFSMEGGCEADCSGTGVASRLVVVASLACGIDFV